MDKHRAKHVLNAVGINVPKGGLYNRQKIAKTHPIELPYVVKPNGQGSSKSVYILHDEAVDMRADIAEDYEMGDEVIVESFIPGRELTVTVMEDRALAVTEIIPQTDWYDFEAKYSEGGSVHVVPADIPKEATQICMDWAVKAHKALGCRGVSRADFRFNEKKSDSEPIVNKIVMLEVNTQPGMTPTSLAPEQAVYVGINFEQLCRWLVEDATWPR
jgi:D-alanine-D-alanine ligase